MDLPLRRWMLLEADQFSYCPALAETGITPMAVLLLPEGLTPGPEAAEVIRTLLDQAREATCGKALLCPAIPAGGFILHPYGEMPFGAAVAHYHELTALCVQAGADAVMVYRAKSMLQARAGVLGARASGLPVLVSMELLGEGEHLLGGTDLLSDFAVLQQLGIAAFGYSTSVTGVQLDALAAICPHREVPVFSISRNLTGTLSAEATGTLFARRAAGLAALGVCSLGIWGARQSQLLQAARALMDSDLPSTSCNELAAGELWAANETQVYYLDEAVEFSQPVACRLDMADDILEEEKELCAVLCIELSTSDEAYAISTNNGLLDQMPVAFLAHDEAALEAALFYYNGRAVIDSRSTLAPDVLKRLAQQYAAVIL